VLTSARKCSNKQDILQKLFIKTELFLH
jgi:hypothetical protein